MGAVEGAERLVVGPDRVLERGGVGGRAFSSGQACVRADQSRHEASSDASSPWSATGRAHSSCPSTRNLADASTEGSVPPFGEQLRQRQRHHEHRAGDVRADDRECRAEVDHREHFTSIEASDSEILGVELDRIAAPVIVEHTVELRQDYREDLLGGMEYRLT